MTALPSKNRLRLYRGYLEASARLDDCHDKLSKTEAEMTALKEMLSSTSKGIIQSELKLMNSGRSLEKSKHSLRLSEDERNQLFTDCIKLEKDLSSAETNIKMLETTLNNLQNEKGLGTFVAADGICHLGQRSTPTLSPQHRYTSPRSHHRLCLNRLRYQR